jgi:hypothetical protein
MRPRTCCTIATLLTLLATAANARERVVIEVYRGERPANAEKWLAPVHDALTERGFASGSSLAAAIDASVSRHSNQLSATQIVEAQRAVSRAYELLLDGDYPAAADNSLAALAVYARAPWQMAREDALRDLQFDALLIAARSYEALGNGEEGFRMMAEALRTFPERQVNTQRFDPRVKDLHRRVRDELANQGVSELRVSVDDPSAVVFINERFVGTGSSKVGNLFSGTYRVFVAKGPDAGRVHTAIIAPRSAKSLAISWRFDRALRTEGGRVVMELAVDDRRNDDVDLAIAAGRALNAESVVVLGIRTVRGRETVVGHSIWMDSQRKTYGAVQMEPITASAAVLARLGAFLAGDKGVDTREIELREPVPSLAERDVHEQRWYGDGWGWALVGTGAVSAATSVALLWEANGLRNDANDEPRQGRRQALRDKADNRTLMGGAAAAVAAALTIGAIVKLVVVDDDDGKRSSSVRAHVAIGTHWFAIEGTF